MLIRTLTRHVSKMSRRVSYLHIYILYYILSENVFCTDRERGSKRHGRFASMLCSLPVDALKLC